MIGRRSIGKQGAFKFGIRFNLKRSELRLIRILVDSYGLSNVSEELAPIPNIDNEFKRNFCLSSIIN